MSKHSWSSRPTANLPRAAPSVPSSKRPRDAAPSSSAADQSAGYISRPDDVCPVCTRDRFLNPSMRLLVSPCFHRACSDCVDKVFGGGKAACPAPGCGRVLYRRDWAGQTFEDLGVEKEVGIRRGLARIFNKREEDFATPEEYDAYLEMVEEIVQNKITGSDAAATDALIDKYRKENDAAIKKNAQRLAEERRLASWREQERLRNLARRRKFYEDLEEREREGRERERDEYLRALGEVGGDRDRVARPKGEQGISFLPDAPFAADDDGVPAEPPWAAKEETVQPGAEDRTWRTWRTDAPEWEDRPGSLQVPEVGRYRDPWWEAMKAADPGWEAGGMEGRVMWEKALRAAVEGLFV
ncbi:CDK-activating kinase assembly factor MAT1-domain-containing protein [Hyaloraphidium curvatum]|nr:CDK-activating kinase assembly factor MAT1-domain-containing protein [Hyaloraphidium curvatum]